MRGLFSFPTPEQRELRGFRIDTRAVLLTGALLATVVASACAGVANPDISVIGQPFMRWTSDAGDPAAHRLIMDPGEVEAVFDAYLNPYARGTFVLAIGDEGLELEEGFFQITRGLPGGLAIKGGKYRVGFGKLNPVHPHAYPFAERFHVLSAYLPGDESINETGVSVSGRIPVPGDFSLTATGDWLNGDTFRIERDPSTALNDPLFTLGPDADRTAEPRPAFVGRLSGFGSIGDRSGYELGVSGAQGTNNVAAGTRTTILGADVKAKLWNSPNSYLIVQGEVFRLDREDAGWDEAAAAYTNVNVTPAGGYLYADYNFNTRYNIGASYERWQQPTADKTWDQSYKLYAGFALLEETTAFRLDWEHTTPGTAPGATVDPEAVDTVTMRVIFSMGPHKAHQF